MKITPVALVGLTGASAVLAGQSPVSARVLPEIPASQVTNYSCYVVTSKGKAFDLSSLCGIGVSRPETLTSNPEGITGRSYQTGNQSLISVRQNPRQQLRLQQKKLRSQIYKNSSISRPSSAISGPSNISSLSNWSYLPERSGDVIGGYATESGANFSSTSNGIASVGSGSGGSKPVQVRDYYRGDGTHVSGHNRSAPSRR